MNPVDSLTIPVSVEYSVAPDVTDNVRAILNEVADLLQQLHLQNSSGSIDLKGLPLLPGELEAIRTILGEGEISLSFDSMGPSTVYETALAGVWWLKHENEDGHTMAEFIEVTHVPDIIKSQPEDIEVAMIALKEQLAELK